MEIFRHYYSGGQNGEWATSIFFQKHMNDFGFCKMDGSPITMDWTAQSGDLTMRYKLDPKKQVYLLMLIITALNQFPVACVVVLLIYAVI